MENLPTHLEVVNEPADPEIAAQQEIPAMNRFSRLRKNKDHKRRQKLVLKSWQKVLLGLFLILVIMLTALATYTFVQGRKLYQTAQGSRILLSETVFLAKTQNLPALAEKIPALTALVQQLDQDYAGLRLYRSIPILNQYYADGDQALAMAKKGVTLADIGVNALLPYSDLLGFSGEGSFTGGTTQDRIVLILQTLKEIEPKIDEMEKILAEIEVLSEGIDPSIYPQKIGSLNLRQNIIDAQAQLSLANQTFHDYRPVLAELGKMAGAEEAQKYLILFQNDNELRPTGGFLTAYSIIKVDKGSVVPEKSGDIYDLDQKFRQRIPIPEVLGKYLITERYWHLRDMNISPDFKSSMETFYEYYQTVPGEPDDVDGIIAVDTHVLTELLQVIGPVSIPGYGTFSAEIDQRCDCPQVVYALSEIITKPTPYLRDDRKGVLGPLMGSILSKTYELDKEKFPELFAVALNSLKGRHVQLYFIDEATQTAAEQINAAGRLYELRPGIKNLSMGENLDFLAIIDANLGGAKSNLFTEYEVKQTVTAPENGFINKIVEISYKNTAKADNCNLEAGQLCLNATLNDWLRIYVPAGSELVEMQGIENEVSVYEEEGLTVFDGYFKLEPLGLAKIIVSYRVPYSETTTYNLKMWKQGGISPVPVLMDVTGGEEELMLDQDLDYSTVF